MKASLYNMFIAMRIQIDRQRTKENVICPTELSDLFILFIITITGMKDDVVNPNDGRMEVIRGY